MSNQMIYNGELIHVKRSEQTWQNQGHYAKQGKMSYQHNQHINVPNIYSYEAREKIATIGILNQDKQSS